MLRNCNLWQKLNGYIYNLFSTEFYFVLFFSQDYEEVNSVIVTKIQFYAIELARNREGHNDQIRHNFKPRKRTAKTALTKDDNSTPENYGHQMTKEVECELQKILTGNHALLK